LAASANTAAGAVGPANWPVLAAVDQLLHGDASANAGRGQRWEFSGADLGAGVVVRV
jgi:hypothetical protein